MAYNWIHCVSFIVISFDLLSHSMNGGSVNLWTCLPKLEKSVKYQVGLGKLERGGIRLKLTWEWASSTRRGHNDHWTIIITGMHTEQQSVTVNVVALNVSLFLSRMDAEFRVKLASEYSRFVCSSCQLYTNTEIYRQYCCMYVKKEKIYGRRPRACERFF